MLWLCATDKWSTLVIVMLTWFSFNSQIKFGLNTIMLMGPWEGSSGFKVFVLTDCWWLLLLNFCHQFGYPVTFSK